MINKSQATFFYVIVGIVAALVVAIFWTYLIPLILAGVFAIVAQPIQRAMHKVFRRKTVSALATLLIIFVVVLGPLVTLSVFVFNEVSGVYNAFVIGDGTLTAAEYAGRVQSALDRVLPDDWVPEAYLSDVQDYFDRGYIWLKDNVQSIFSNALILAGNLFIFILGLFFFLRDGDKFKQIIIKLSPLQNEHDERIMRRIGAAVNSVVLGTLLVALAQGLLAGIGFMIFGLPSPVLWASVAAIASLIPSVGTALVMVPAALFVGVVSGWWWGLGLLAWGILIVGSIDNILRPLVIERGVNIHPFLILLSVFGGLSLFGFSGFIIGPIVLSLMFALTDIYRDVLVQKV